ncbi:MAG: T9SS type A sorting domain-containing protein [Bacteroidales bacterium]|jgi:Leucine-rich repeat (LRR) protein|nr:T9SS type A sorting domain-containing protein [Bacteroidales bacterium]
MKKIYALILTGVLLFCSGKVFSQNYHEDDKEGLRTFLRQPSTVSGKLNLEALGLSVTDTLDWTVSENWITKLNTARICVWNSNNPQRLTGFTYGGLSEPRLSGSLDCSKFQYLITLVCRTNDLSSLNVTQNSYLETLDCSSNPLGTLNISQNTNLINLNCQRNQLVSLDVSNNPNLNSLTCDYNQINSLDVSTHPNLATLICTENQLSFLDVSNNLLLRMLSCGHNRLVSLDLRNNASLIDLQCHFNQLADIDISRNINLTNVSCSSNQLVYLDVSQNINLKKLSCDWNQLTGLDVSGNILLTNLSCGANQLDTLDVSRNILMQQLECSNNPLRNLDVRQNVNLKSLTCTSCQLTSLNINQTSQLNTVRCNYNFLKFSALPVLNIPSYSYDRQKTIDGGEVTYDQEIDLSSEYIVNGNYTNYRWWEYISENNSRSVNVQDNDSGRFVPGEENAGKILICKMTNASFPSLIYLEYQVKVKANLKLLDHLALDESPRPDYYEARSGETFKIYAHTTAHPDSVKIGLFKTNNFFVEDIHISRSSYTYTCRISNSMTSGSYMIQPYIMENGIRQIIERPANSHLVDKLPFSFTRIAGYSVFSGPVSTSTILQSHLVLNTSERNFHKVYIDTPFRVVVNVPVTTNTRMGLFDSFGNFMEDVTVSVAAKVYTCQVSWSIFPDYYMLMPYEEVDGEIRIIERMAGAAVMDRLPIAVDYDFGLFSEKENSTEKSKKLMEKQEPEISFYPNPVVNDVTVQADSDILTIQIYDLNGKMVKYAKRSSQISVSGLQPGTYLLKVTTSQGTTVRQIIKE